VCFGSTVQKCLKRLHDNFGCIRGHSVVGPHLRQHLLPVGTQWSFRKQETMGTLASRAEIGVWVQAPGAPLLRGSGGITPESVWDCIHKILQSGAFFGRKIVRSAVHNAFLNTLTMGKAFPRVAPRYDAWSLSQTCPAVDSSSRWILFLFWQRVCTAQRQPPPVLTAL